MMSGGDLDGDQYFICWDKKLLSQEIEIYSPASYTSKGVTVDKPPIHTKNIADHLVFYLERDVLGKLSNMWVALCDKKG